MNEISRTKNAARNIAWGLICNCITIILPFITKTTIIYVMGIEYDGLNGVFSSILSVLSFAELGLGSALVYSMYKPLSNGDVVRIRALQNFYKKSYRIIGTVILGIGLCILPFLKRLIHSGIPETLNIYYLYLIYLANNVLSYWIYAEKNSLLLACQRVDINSRITLAVKLLLNMAQIVIILFSQNYYGYVLAIPVFTVVNNVFTAYAVKKIYPEYYCAGKLDSSELYEIKKNVGGIFFQKIGNIVLSSVDSIIISTYLGLKILGIYNGYMYIITSLFTFLIMIQKAIIPSIGNSMVSASTDKNFEDFKKFTLIYQWIVIWWSACLLCLVQPFITLWLGSKLVLPDSMAILFVIYFFFYKWFDIVYVYREAGGIWWQGKWMPLIAALVNLSVNIILVQVIGLAGVLISTVISLIVIHDTIGVYILKKYVFKSQLNLKEFYKEQFSCLLSALIVCAATYGISWMIMIENTILVFLFRFIICMLVPNGLLYLLWRKNPTFEKGKDFLINNVLGHLILKKRKIK